MKKLAFFLILAAAHLPGQGFADYRMRYDHYAEDDSTAFRHVRPYIAEAKRKKDYRELTQAYKDAISFSPDKKTVYADSMIWAASKSRDRDLLANAYLSKGTVYYFNYRKFKPALDEYLKAWEYAQHSENKYLYYKNLYHIGVVKSYLGYYREAAEIFEKCSTFFRHPQSIPEPPNLAFNRKKGYLNTLHQQAVCLLHLHRTEEAADLADRGLAKVGAESDFYLERSYFYKVKGIASYREKHDSTAIRFLSTALAGFEKKNDFTNATVAYYYKGKSEYRLGNSENAIRQFIKIDSVFRKHLFILPEVREAYEYLINYYHAKGAGDQELYYTTQLLKADQIISADFKYLSGKIYKEYDTQDLLKAKKRLEASAPYFYLIIGGLAVFSVWQLIYLYRRRKKENALYRKYLELLERAEIQQKDEGIPMSTKRDYKISDKALVTLLHKLEIFEKSRLFLEKGLTRYALSETFGTNESYLSKVINTYKGNNFNGYLNQLRIGYITQLLRESSKYRNYSVEALSNECGFTDRSRFSKAFTEMNGLSPVEFIAQLNRESLEM